MNKSDKKLILMIIFIVTILLTLIHLIPTKEATKALVYYDNHLIKTINLTKDHTYAVEGLNGTIDIEVKNKKIRVTSETSPKHLCSKQGWISKSNQSIICLPNKIVIKITGEQNLDTIVK